MTALYLLAISNLAFELIFEPKKEVPGPPDFLQAHPPSGTPLAQSF